MFGPTEFAHGFCVLSETAVFTYKCSDYYAPASEWGVLWSDAELGIDWPVKKPLVSSKDAALPRLRDVPKERLPLYK
jgi:dTDP-4-dehydrorhamnose 3,5-epimerase